MTLHSLPPLAGVWRQGLQIRAWGLGWWGYRARTRGNLAAAMTALQQRELLYRRADDSSAQANVLLNYGEVLRLSRQYDGARQAHEQALMLYCQLAYKPGIANALHNLGIVEGAQRHWPL